MGLRQPPKVKKAGGLIGRFIGLVLMLAVFAVVIWSVATNQQARAIERSDPTFDLPGRLLVVADQDLHVQEFGSGPGLLLIHDDNIIGGLGLEPLAQALAEAGWRVLVPDLPGFGFSGRPPEPGRHYTVAGMAELVAMVVEEDAPLWVVGLGWGGEVGAELAVARPDLVTGLDLVDTVDIPTPTDRRHDLSGLPFGVGEAFAFTLEGAGGSALGRFLADCPVGVQCNEETLDLYRRAAEVPGTARAIWARRATPAAALAPTRLERITADVRLLALDRSPDALAELAARFLGAEVVEAADLVSALGPGANSPAARAASP